MSKTKSEQKEAGVITSFLNKIKFLLILFLGATLACWYFRSEVPPAFEKAFAWGHDQISSNGLMPDFVAENFQIPCIAGVMAAAAGFLLLTFLRARKNPKTVATFFALIIGVGLFVYFGMPEPGPVDPIAPVVPDNPDVPVDPNAPVVSVKFVNRTPSKVNVWSSGKNYGEIGRNGGSKSFDIPAFSRVTFEAEPELRNGYVIPTIVLSSNSQSYELDGHRAWGDVPNRRKIEYYRANKYSYDIRYIDPFAIDSSTVKYERTPRPGGLRRKIFKDFNDLKDSTYHYRETDVSDYYIENHFNAVNVNSGWTKAEGTAYGSAQSFKEGFTGSVSAEAEFGGC